jgi:hypothetical protein
LEVELPLDGGYQRARIPPSWQLQVFIDDRRGYLRHVVTRSTTMTELQQVAARHTGVPCEDVKLTIAGSEIEDGAKTIEDLDLFVRSKDLAVTFRMHPDST